MRGFRTVSFNKKIKNAVKSEYDGVQFKSNLEKFCYQQLKINKIPFEYQPKSFILLESFEIDFECYELIGKIYREKETKKISNDTRRFDLVTNVRDIKYTPDFIDLQTDFSFCKWIIETKGFANDAFPLRWKLFKEYLTKNRFYGKLFKPENQKQVIECINIIKKL